MNHNHKNYKNLPRLVSLTFVILIVTRHKPHALNEKFSSQTRPPDNSHANFFLSVTEHSEQHKSTSLKKNTLVNVSFHRKNSDDARAFFKPNGFSVFLIFIEMLVAFEQLMKKKRFK